MTGKSPFPTEADTTHVPSETDLVQLWSQAKHLHELAIDDADLLAKAARWIAKLIGALIGARKNAVRPRLDSLLKSSSSAASPAPPRVTSPQISDLRRWLSERLDDYAAAFDDDEATAILGEIAAGCQAELDRLRAEVDAWVRSRENDEPACQCRGDAKLPNGPCVESIEKPGRCTWCQRII